MNESNFVLIGKRSSMGKGRSLRDLESNLDEAFSILNNFNANKGVAKRRTSSIRPDIDYLDDFIQPAYNSAPPSPLLQKRSSLGRAGNLEDLERNLNEAFNIFNELNSRNKKNRTV